MIIPRGSWVVSEIAVGGELVPPLDGTALTLASDELSLSGFSGINRFSGSMTPDGMGPLASTRMAGSPEQMEQEQLYLSHLERVETIESCDSGINLVASGIVLLCLVPAE